jgi:menaquinone-specific isochorismate synthase
MDPFLTIAAQVHNFFKYDLIDLPPEMAGKILRIEVQISTLEPLSWLARQSRLLLEIDRSIIPMFLVN